MIGVFVFFALFVSATIFFFVGPETIFKNDCTSGSKITLVDELYNLSTKASKDFCTTKYPCFINSTNTGSFLATKLKEEGKWEELDTLPRNSSKIRLKNRCLLTGRPKGYMRDFGICRVMFRKMANEGKIPGITKASW